LTQRYQSAKYFDKGKMQKGGHNAQTVDIKNNTTSSADMSITVNGLVINKHNLSKRESVEVPVILYMTKS
jgi:hypothetical protein